MKRFLFLICCALFSAPSMAGLNCDITATYRNSLSVPPTPVDASSFASLIINQLTGDKFTELVVLAEGTNGNNTTSVELAIDTVSHLIAATTVLINGQSLARLIPSQPPIVFSFEQQQPIMAFSGSGSLYAISLGGVESYRLAEGICTLSDSLVITSAVARTIAHPVSFSASGFAAESFGDPNVTRGRVEASVSGSIGGAAASAGQFEIESVSVIPEMGSATGSAMPLIQLNPGPNSIPYSITTTFRVIADAKCAGLFCSLTGSSTAGLTIPDGLTRNSGAPQGIRIGPFTDESGGPLPDDVSIVSETSGIIYADPGGAVADTDQDGIADTFDNCLGIENSAQRDTDEDGFGNRCDADLNNDCQINFLDLAAIKDVFFSTDPDADFDGNAAVDFLDLAIMKQSFFTAPGPSSLAACL